MKALGLGDWRRLSVSELWDRQRGDPFFHILREHGFRRIYEIVADRDPELFKELPSYGEAMSVCHFCSKVMHGSVGERVRQVVNHHLDERLTSVFDSLVGLNGCFTQTACVQRP